MKHLIAAAFATLIPAAPSLADPVCMDASEMEAALIDWYGEAPVDGAWVDDQQLWASEATGTWTLMELRADGTACVLSQGDTWTGGDDMLIALERSIDDRATSPSDPIIAFFDGLASSAS